MIRVASLRSKFIDLTWRIGGFDLPRSVDFEDLVLEANNLDAALAAWSSNLPDDWAFARFIHVSPQEEINSLLYDGSWVSYKTHGHAVVWNRYRTIRLIVNSIRVRLLSSTTGSQNHHLNEHLEVFLETINSLTTDMCRSVGFFLIPFYPSNGGRDAKNNETVYPKFQFCKASILPKMATVLAWPLAVANSIDAVPSSQKQWLQCTLQKISDIIGAAVVDALNQSVDFHF